MQRGIERSFFDPKVIVGRLLNALGDDITVQRPGAVEDFQDQEVKRSLEPIILMFGHGSMNSQLYLAACLYRVSEASVNAFGAAPAYLPARNVSYERTEGGITVLSRTSEHFVSGRITRYRSALNQNSNWSKNSRAGANSILSARPLIDRTPAAVPFCRLLSMRFVWYLAARRIVHYCSIDAREWPDTWNQLRACTRLRLMNAETFRIVMDDSEIPPFTH